MWHSLVQETAVGLWRLQSTGLKLKPSLAGSLWVAIGTELGRKLVGCSEAAADEAGAGS